MDVTWATNCLLFMLIISLLQVVTASIAAGFSCVALQCCQQGSSYPGSIFLIPANSNS